MSFPQPSGSDVVLGRGASAASDLSDFSLIYSSSFAFFHCSAALPLMLNFSASPISVCKSVLHPGHTYGADLALHPVLTFSQPPSVSTDILNSSRSNVCHHSLSLKRRVTSPPFLPQKCVVYHFFQHSVQSCPLSRQTSVGSHRSGHRPDLPVLFHNGFWVLPEKPYSSWSSLHVLPVEVAMQVLPMSMQLLPISLQILFGEKRFGQKCLPVRFCFSSVL